MELKQIKELMAAMGRTGTKRVSLKRDDFEIVIEREDNGRYIEVPFDEQARPSLSREDAALSRGKEMPRSTHPIYHVDQAVQEEVSQVAITSPMVGTYYGAPSPEDPSFVKVGDKVDKNTIVCIIEAMKVMNEIKAGVAGTIAEVLVESGQPVEFGTKLFRIT